MARTRKRAGEIHPLVTQLRFTRSEFLRTISGVPEKDAQRRLLPMNCLSWNVGHLAWQEQRYFLGFGMDAQPYPDIAAEFTTGGPASTPTLARVLDAWRAITRAADPWLDGLTTANLLTNAMSKGKPIAYTFGNLLQRVIYHYWYHTGENMAIRQQLGHTALPQFVGNIDDRAPFTGS
ncbi:MAG TPA: DinB family protein [Candidatus Limnocylindria bacterium]|nr:DinB family protein [Candidatus Limnocylindria bacterium]